MDANGCFSATCGNQRSQDISVANQCKIAKTVVEDVDGCKCCPLVREICASNHEKGLTQLPGNPMPM